MSMLTKDGQRIACGTCLFFCPLNGSAKGVCRLNPPQVFLVGASPHALDPTKIQVNFQQVLPTMQAHEEWCGHWQIGNPYNKPETQPEEKAEPEPASKSSLILPK